jgi:hypothetical protein
MSRQNKVNPGTYTQRGRLSQDDIARELVRQRAIGSPEPWPPEQHHPFQAREALKQDNSADGEENLEPAEPVKKKKKSAGVKAKAARTTGRTRTAKTTVKTKSLRSAKTAKSPTAKRTRMSAKVTKPAAKARGRRAQ